MKEKLLITGGLGFIFSQFVKAYSEKYDIGILDSLTYAGDIKRIPDQLWQNINFYHGDVRNLQDVQQVLKAFQPDYIIHSAAESHVDNSIATPHIFIDTNINGTLNMLLTAIKYPVKKFINVSTDEVYGSSTSFEDIKTENSPFNPSSPYSVSKTAQDMLGKAYYKMFDIPVITVRPSNGFGILQNKEKFIPTVIQNLANGLPIPVYGDGQQVREWQHTSNICSAVDFILENGIIGEVYNVAGYKRLSNIAIIELIADYMKSKYKINPAIIQHIEDRLNHDFAYRNSGEKLKKLGFNSTADFYKEIESAIDSYASLLMAMVK